MVKRSMAVVTLLFPIAIASNPQASNAGEVFPESQLDAVPLEIVTVDNSMESARDDESIPSQSPSLNSNSIRLSPARAVPPHASEAKTFSLEDDRIRRVASALSVVVGTILLLAVLRRTFFSRRKPTPSEMVEVLSRTVVSPKHVLHLVRVRDRMILLAETPSGLTQLETLSLLEAETNIEESEANLPNAQNGGDDSKRLLEMIRNSDSWKSLTPSLADTRLRDTSYAA